MSHSGLVRSFRKRLPGQLGQGFESSHLRKVINGIKIIQDMDQALLVMNDAGQWLLESGKNPDKWWHPKNMNKTFMLKHAEPSEFYVALVEGKPAASVVLQDNERNQSWEPVDKGEPMQALYLHWVCVSRGFAGMNLPRALVDFANQQAKIRQFKLLRLDTNADEGKLCKVYEDLGFKLMAIEQEADGRVAYYQKEVMND